MPQDAPKTPQEDPQTAQWAPKTRPRRTKKPPRRSYRLPKRVQNRPKAAQIKIHTNKLRCILKSVFSVPSEPPSILSSVPERARRPIRLHTYVKKLNMTRIQTTKSTTEKTSPFNTRDIHCTRRKTNINLARRNARSDPPPISGRRAESLNPGPSESFQSQSSKAKVLGV